MATLYRWRYGGTLMVTLKAVQKRSSQVDSKGLQAQLMVNTRQTETSTNSQHNHSYQLMQIGT